MKKLIIAAAIVCAAAISQASSVTWGANANFCDKDGNILTSSTVPAGNVVLVYLGNTGDQGGWSWDKAEVVQNGKVTPTTSMGNPKCTAGETFILLQSEGWKNGDVFAVMFADGEDLSYLKTVGSGAEIKTTYTVSGFDNDSSTLPAFTFATANYYAESVPEPTSGLLLLLGVAGLALKRRRA